jgi:hypothetical protein
VPLLIWFIGIGFLINYLSTIQKEFVMKNLILTCVVLSLVFIFGCQESSITDPTQPLAKSETGSVNHNIIGLKYQLADPSTGAAYVLSGQVAYQNTVLPAINDDGKTWVKVRLEMSSQLNFDMAQDHPIWKIEQKSEDKVFFINNTDAAKRLHKTYRITNRRDIKLCVTYLISFKAVKVVAISLRPCKNYVTDDDATN